MKTMKTMNTIFALAVIFMVGCGKSPTQSAADKIDKSPKTVEYVSMPTFNWATSEYPSWSIIVTAAKAGLINGEKGKLGTLEEKWGVDVVLLIKDYDPCLALYATDATDAVCITNVDVLNASLGRPGTAICATSTSKKADKVIAVGFASFKDLVGKKIFGLDKSVSRYTTYRTAELSGVDPNSIQFVNLDPGAAAIALQNSTGDVEAICVWNPQAMETLRNKKESAVIADSGMIPEEVIDMVVIGNDSLKKEGGEKFAGLVCDVYYTICSHLNSPDQKIADAILTALGEDFCKLPLDDMRIIVQETSFYDTPEKGIALFSDDAFKTRMETIVVPTCVKIQMFDEGKSPPTIGYNDPSKQLNFSTKYMEMSQSKK